MTRSRDEAWTCRSGSTGESTSRRSGRPTPPGERSSSPAAPCTVRTATWRPRSPLCGPPPSPASTPVTARKGPDAAVSPLPATRARQPRPPRRAGFMQPGRSALSPDSVAHAGAAARGDAHRRHAGHGGAGGKCRDPRRRRCGLHGRRWHGNHHRHARGPRRGAGRGPRPDDGHGARRGRTGRRDAAEHGRPAWSPIRTARRSPVFVSSWTAASC